MAIHAPAEHERDVPPLETMTRAVLKAFADAASRGYSWRSLNTFRFMENCIVELLRLDKASAYRIGYAWIRQLALILRSSSISTSQGASEKNKKKGKGKQPLHALVGWPFVRAVYLWTRAVGAVPALKPLAYPLSMIVIGAVKSKITSLQHFPFVCHCLRNLNRLGSSLETFVPVSSHLLKVFSVMLASMEKSHRKGSGGGQTGGPSKAPDLEVLLRFRDGQVSETLSMEAVGGSLCFLLTDHLGLLSQSPAFPEISAPVLMHLKRYSKHCPSESLRRQLKSILTSAETSAEDVRARRDSLNDAPSWKKFLVFEADTALAKARTDALRRVASEEQARVQAERDQGGGAGHADGATKDERVKKHEEEAGKSKRALKRARVKNQKQEEQQEQEQLESDALAKPKGKKRRKNTVAALPDKDVVEEMDFSSGEGE